MGTVETEARRNMNEELDLDVLQRLADAATEGPWKWTHEPGADDGALESPSEEGYVLCAHGLHTEGFIDVGVADAEFIAAARSAVPALLDRVRETHEAWAKAWMINESLAKERDAALSTIARVRELHYEEDHECAECSFEPMPEVDFRGVSVPWPCPTVRALGSVPSTEEGNDGMA